MKPFGVSVSIIEPGFFKTNVTRLDLIEADLRRLWSRLPQPVKDSYGPTYFDECEWGGPEWSSGHLRRIKQAWLLWCLCSHLDLKAQDFSMGLLCSPDISKVTRCMEHALTARFPRSRYAAGWDAKLLWIPLTYVPAFVSDFFYQCASSLTQGSNKLKPWKVVIYTSVTVFSGGNSSVKGAGGKDCWDIFLFYKIGNLLIHVSAAAAIWTVRTHCG